MATDEPENPALERCIAELMRQREASRAVGLGWFDPTDPRCATIDGDVDLVALVEAILG